MQVSDKAPLVQLAEICNLSVEEANGCEVVCEICNTVVYREGTMLGLCKCKKKKTSFKVPSLLSLRFMPNPFFRPQVVPVSAEPIVVEADDETRISIGTAEYSEPPTLPSPSGNPSPTPESSLLYPLFHRSDTISASMHPLPPSKSITLSSLACLDQSIPLYFLEIGGLWVSKLSLLSGIGLTLPVWHPFIWRVGYFG